MCRRTANPCTFSMMTKVIVDPVLARGGDLQQR